MISRSTSTSPGMGGSIQITVESEDSGLWFDAEQRYTLRYGIG